MIDRSVRQSGMGFVALRILPAVLVLAALAGTEACGSRQVSAKDAAGSEIGDAASGNATPTGLDGGNEVAEPMDGSRAKPASRSADAGHPQERAPSYAKPKPGTMCGHTPNAPGCDCFGAHPDPTCGDP
jgi:hypothetical protein